MIDKIKNRIKHIFGIHIWEKDKGLRRCTICHAVNGEDFWAMCNRLYYKKYPKELNTK